MDTLFSGLLSVLFFPFSFFLLGAGIKYVDDAFDESTFSKNKALLLSPFLGIFYAFLISLNSNAGTILLSFLIGVFLSGKINNLGFYIQVVFLGLYLVIFDNVHFSILPLFALVLASVLDEKGNDLSDKKKIKNRLIHFWFEHRLLMDFVALLLTLFGYIEIVFFVSFLAFDFGYFLVGKYSKNIKKH